MNHDYAHCFDYKQDECPADCFRASLTEELMTRSDLIGIPMTWTHFFNTEYCPRTEGHIGKER